MPRYDLKKYYVIFTELGIIGSLLFTIAATNLNLQSPKTEIETVNSQELLSVIELLPVIPPKKIAPQKPMIFTPKPNDAIIEEEIPEFINFDDAFGDIILPPEIEEQDEELIIDYLPQMPEIIGGLESLYSKIKYPKFAQATRLEGRVAVQFIIDKQGKVTEPTIIRGVHPELDNEVLRVIKLIKFTPGVQNGTLVKVRMVQTVYFKLK